MARATFKQIVAYVQRKPGLENLPLGEILDAVDMASKDLGNQPWPWNYAETNVLVPPPYTTGTVTIANGTGSIVGNGTNWASYVGQDGWRIRFGNSNLDYIISAILTPNTMTLAQPINLAASLTNSSYTLYKDTYEYPSDYILGSDVALLQPLIRTRIPKVPRYKFEIVMNAGLRSFSTNIQMFYCDQGQNASGTAFQFRLGPPPAGPSELRLCYHSMAPTMAPTDLSRLPEGYDEVIGLVAASKLYDVHKLPGEADGCKMLAAGKLRLLKRQVATQTIDDTPNASYETPDSSISQWGMMIGRMP
jgi:hypothetical protein